MISRIRGYLDRWKHYKKDLSARQPVIGFIVETIDTLAVALFIALVLRYYILQTSYIPSESMVPTLKVKDRLLVNKFIYKFRDPRRGEIVVFRSPQEGPKPFINTFIGIGGETPFVKRLIGMPGDRIKMEHGIVYINDSQLIIPGVNIQRDYSSLPETLIPADHYFVLGDNRPNSSDSRYWGFVHRDDFRGLAFFTFWPLRDIEWLR